jgi:hypothetical protein
VTPTPQWSRALLAAALLLSSVSCGPKVVVARLATPTAEVSRAAATPTPPARPQPPALSPPPASAVPAPRLPTATASATARPTPASAVITSPRPTATGTATAKPTPAPAIVATELPPTRTPPPSPTETPVAAAAPPRPSPSATATRTPVHPSPPPVATVTRTPIPPPTNSPSPPAAAAATRDSASLAPSAPAPVTRPAAGSWIGEWDFRAEAGSGILAGTLRFRTAVAGLAGTYAGLHGNTTELSNLSAAGDRISFDLVTPHAVWHLVGTLSGDRIEGTFQTAERTIPWSASRKGPASPALTPSRN